LTGQLVLVVVCQSEAAGFNHNGLDRNNKTNIRYQFAYIIRVPKTYHIYNIHPTCPNNIDFAAMMY